MLAVVFATAQTPKINYQAVVRDSHNRLVTNTTIQVEVTVTYNGGTYSESLSGTTNANGLLSLEIGGGNNFNLIDWSTATIQTTAHLPGNETLQDEVNVTAVPFALYAEYADSVNMDVIANYLNTHYIPSGTGTSVQSDWNQENQQAADYIKNKPTIPAAQVNADWNATSGAAQILNKPTIPTVPTNVSGFTNDAKYVANANCDSLDFCKLMGKVNTLVEEMNEFHYAYEDLSNFVGVLYGFIDSLGHVIDSLEGLIDDIGVPTIIAPEGAINGRFSVSSTKKVYFSKGNLQATTTDHWSSWTFSFMEHQYSTVETNANPYCDENYFNKDTVSLFGWATSGYNHGATYYQPYNTNAGAINYYAYGDEPYNLYDQTGKADWGFNAISNGGDTDNSGWRTLTKDEWVYLFDHHEWGAHTVHGQNGIIILPDRMRSATGFTSGWANWTSVSDADWDAMEAAGAVFLPAAGGRGEKIVSNFGNTLYYWSSTRSPEHQELANCLHFAKYMDAFYPDSSTDRSNGLSVRLVKNAN